MKREKQGILVLGIMVLAMFLLFPGAVMKAKAGESVNANLTIYFVEDVRGDTIGSTDKNITIIKNESEDGSTITYSGTIDLSDVTYINDDIPNDRRSIFGWYDSGWTSFSGPYVFENVSDADGVVEIELYALCSKTIMFTFNSNHANYGGAYDDNKEVSISYPQSTVNETSKTITLPENPESELSFKINGYVFKGWAERESGDVEIVKTKTVQYGNDSNNGNTYYYAHWQDQRHSPDVPITGVGQYYLEPGTAYSLGSGTWTVNGGSTKYTGGITFYVNSAGYYTFSK